MQENKVLDKNSTMLLSVIDSCGTVKDACDKIGISYSKAWKIIGELEEALDYPLLERRQGGESGGKSFLTSKGRELINKYERFVKEVNAYTDKSFKKHFGGKLEY